MDEFFQETDPSGGALLLYTLKDDLTVGAMIFCHPLRDLLLLGVTLGRPWRTRFRDHCFRVREICAHRRS
jgi:hypothetical protein